MNNAEYGFDVAFSFLQQDEPLAIELDGLLQGRLKTFLYSKQQGEIAGTDGERTFGDVFGKNARVVVVLHRANWGSTPWTRIEETAIRNRAFERGYDFVLFIPLDSHPQLPIWLPKNRIWIGLTRWGPSGAASVIEQRVQEMGGMPSEESAEDRAVRLQLLHEEDEQRKRFLESDAGVEAANTEFAALCSELKQRVESIQQAAGSFRFLAEEEYHRIVVRSFGISLTYEWQLAYRNTLKDSLLAAALWDGNVSIQQRYRDKPQEIERWIFHFDVASSGEYCWRLEDQANRVMRTNDVLEEHLKKLMDAVHERRSALP